MATVPRPSPPSPAQPSRNGAAKDVELVEYDRFIDKQIHRTRQTVKLVDLTYAGLQLVVGVVVALLAATLIEHWLVPGGFNQPTRFLLFGLLVGSTGYFFVRRLWPLLRGRINPVYAAHTIERGHPTLKNSLVNFLLFRTRREQMPAAVYDALEQQAAQGLARVPVDLAVDRMPLIRWGYVLVAVVVLGALYAAFSPKHPFATAGRVLVPWAAIAPPSRVNVERVVPGTATITQGETMTVFAEVRGLRDDETVRLRYTTADGQEVDADVAMRPSESGLRYEAELPPATAKSFGLDSDLTYRIEAGDARTIDYQVTVVTAPTIVVRQVQYEYPDYTGYLDGRVDNLGDIRGIEGTRVTIHAEANGLIDSAELDFEADGRSDLRMKSDGTNATVSFVLALRDDRRTPQHTGYTLRFKNQEGRTNLRPAQFKIDVIPDYAPEVELIAPEERVRDVRLDETVVVAVDARDPDFGLTDVSLVGQSTGRNVFERPLLVTKDRHEGRFTSEFRFTPHEHELKPGDEVQYWATARDNRQPEANEAASSHKTFRIVDPEPQQPDPNALAQNDRPREQPQQPGEGQEQPQQPGQEGAGEAQQQPGDQGGQQGDESAAQPGDAAGGQPEQGQPGEGAEGGQAAEGAGEGAKPPSGEPGGEPFSREARPGGQAAPSEPSAQPGEEDQQGEPQQNGQPGEGQPSGQSGKPNDEQQQSPVANNGSDDGTAFERISEHLNKDNQEGGPGQRREGGEGLGDSAAKPASGEPSAPQPQDNQPGAETEGQSKPGEQQGPEQDPDAGERRGEEQPAGRPDQERPDASQGTGAKTQAGSPDSKEAQQQAVDDQTKSSGGEQQRPRGEPGQGGQEKPQGAPDGEQPLQQRQKTPGDPNEKPEQDDQEPPGASDSKKESDSRGEEGGDRAGGGQEGGGQKAPREGTGSAGQNQAADEGAGRSADQGPGESTTQPGSDAESEQPTGEPGEQSTGEGTGRRDGTGDQPGGEQGAQPTGEEGAKPPSGEPFSREAESAEPSAQSGADAEQPQGEGQQPGQQGGARGNPTTGGNTGSETQALPGVGKDEAGDEANLQYARRQTELTLEKLSDQLRRKKVDQEMLDKLGWSEEDLQRFVERWRERMAAAKRSDEQGQAAKQELDQALRQLGPRRPEALQSATERQQDNVRDLSDGPRAPVPLEWQEWMRAYNQGVSRSGR